MQELIELLVSKFGISEDLARQIVPTVINFLKDKLPAPIASQLEGLLSGQGGEGGLGGMLGGLGGILGGKKEG